MKPTILFLYFILGAVINIYIGYKRYGLIILNPFFWFVASLFGLLWPYFLVEYIIDVKKKRV